MEEESVDELKTIFSDFSEEQQEAIIAGILKSSGIYGATEVGKFLLQMIHSDEAASRIKAARIIGNIGKKDFYHPLIALLNDPDEGVQKEAIMAAGKVQNLKLVPPLLEHIKENILHNHCFRALEKIGPDSLDSVIQLMNESSDVHLLRRLVRLCSKFSNEKSVHFLLKHLKHPVELVRSEVIYSLFILNFKAQKRKLV
jgi:HEAT repeat protein